MFNIFYIFYAHFQMILFEEQKADEKILFAENPVYGKTIDVYKLPFCTLLWKVYRSNSLLNRHAHTCIDTANYC